MRSAARSCALLAILVVCAGPGADAQLPDLDGSISDPGDLLEPEVDDVLPSPGTEFAPRVLGPDGRAVVVDHAAALQAVQDRRALPLNDLLKRVANAYRGQVIDVQLVRAGGALLYEVKMLDAHGSVSLMYFSAANGTPTARPPR
jgi:hypothetical protein